MREMNRDGWEEEGATLCSTVEIGCPAFQPSSLSSGKSDSSVGESCMGTGGDASFRMVTLLRAFLPYKISLGATCKLIPDPGRFQGAVRQLIMSMKAKLLSPKERETKVFCTEASAFTDAIQMMRCPTPWQIIQ